MSAPSPTSYDDLFGQATALAEAPYGWQRRLATGSELPEVVRIPTGAGKTEGAVLGWLWRRRLADQATRDATPRRLVYCLPMRVLVEQTVARCEAMLARLGLDDDIRVHQLMGGAVAREWIERPEDDAILVGTLDQLLSRALMRGYGVSRYAWPVHYALLHNDALWVLDEVQLFGEALATSAQLDGLRAALPPGLVPSATVWMSATVDPAWIETVDRPVPERVLELDDADRTGRLRRRLEADKRIEEVATLDAATVLARHRPGTLTLVVLNTVTAARDLHRALSRSGELGGIDLTLIHSRFRPPERRAATSRLIQEAIGPEGRIAVATQVVEAGIDISAATLFIEAAPWGSVVQRLGRCNRYGEQPVARALWAAPQKPAPYEAAPVERAVAQLRALEAASGSPAALERLDAPLEPPPRRHVLRRRDLVGLFDTAPDLSGLDLDVSRFIRDAGDLSVALAWRELPDGRPRDDEPELHGEELCPVAIGEMRDVIQREARAERPRPVYRHDPVVGGWTRIGPNDLRPGDRLLADVGFGRYAPERGFDPALKPPVAPAAIDDRLTAPETTGSDALSSGRGIWLSLIEHTDGVCAELEGLLPHFPGLSEGERGALRGAARLHDWGKAHHVFADAMRGDGSAVPERLEAEVIAKREGRAARYARPGFRHELASLLAMLSRPEPDPLVAYLVASHHGRVRLGARTVPRERWPDPPGRAFMLGCWEGDALPATELGGGVSMPPTPLDLGPLQLGAARGETYTDMALALLERLGPTRLAFLEALLRTADTRRSAKEARLAELADA